jgi:hypothetical protein
MVPTRLYLVDVPRMLEDIIRQAVEPAVEVVCGPPDMADPTERTKVITVVGNAEEARCLELLRACPEATILAVEKRSGAASLLELWPQRRPLGELTPQLITRAVGTATPWGERAMRVVSVPEPHA